MTTMKTPKFKSGQKVRYANKVATGWYLDENDKSQPSFPFESHFGEVLTVVKANIPTEGSGWGIKYSLSRDEYGMDTISWMPEESLEDATETVKEA